MAKTIFRELRGAIVLRGRVGRLADTYMMFVDASGDPGLYQEDIMGRPKNSKFYVLAGLIVKPEDWYTLHSGLRSLAKKYFPKYLKKHIMIPEFHYYDLRRRKGAFRELSEDDAKRLEDEIFGLITGSPVKAIVIVVDKIKYMLKYKIPKDIKQVSLNYLLDRYERFLKGRDSYGLVIYDQEGSKDKDLQIMLESFRVLGSTDHRKGMKWTYERIVETMFTIKSEMCIGLQLADFIAGAAFQCFERGRCEQWMQLEVILDRSPWNEIMNWGLKIIP